MDLSYDFPLTLVIITKVLHNMYILFSIEKGMSILRGGFFLSWWVVLVNPSAYKAMVIVVAQKINL